jgi:THO complex subunit 4
VVYEEARDAKVAIREFDGANANGQPIRLTLVANKPARNPFDTAVPPGRSLADRIESPAGNGGGRRRGDDSRSASPPKGRRSDVSKPPPDHIDRYVPGQRSSRPRGGRTDSGRRPGARREQSNQQRGGRDDNGRMTVQGRPRKTAEELDAEMADYWGNSNEPAGSANQDDGTAAAATDAANPAPAAGDADVDMIS